MALTDIDYVPTLAIRPSEMNGLQNLPGPTKDALQPCFLLAPWVNSGSLDKAIDRIEKAFQNRPYFLDLDRDYIRFRLPDDSVEQSTPQKELVGLKNPDNGFFAWTEFVKKQCSGGSLMEPCVQMQNATIDDVQQQIDAFSSMQRNFCLRFEKDRFLDNMEEVLGLLNNVDSECLIILVEGGWIENSQLLEAWFNGTVTKILEAINPPTPVVISCTSIPTAFHMFSGLTPHWFNERRVFNELSEKLAARFGNYRLVYGDWGSTRPRGPITGGNRPIQRIDFPQDDNWLIARSKDKDWSYQDAAKAIIAAPNIWQEDMNIWGEDMILRTSLRQSLGIDTPQKNVAVRVNIHIHRQALISNPDIGSADFDEDWED